MFGRRQTNATVNRLVKEPLPEVDELLTLDDFAVEFRNTKSILSHYYFYRKSGQIRLINYLINSETRAAHAPVVDMIRSSNTGFCQRLGTSFSACRTLLDIFNCASEPTYKQAYACGTMSRFFARAFDNYPLEVSTTLYLEPDSWFHICLLTHLDSPVVSSLLGTIIAAAPLHEQEVTLFAWRIFQCLSGQTFPTERRLLRMLHWANDLPRLPKVNRAAAIALLKKFFSLKTESSDTFAELVANTVPTWPEASETAGSGSREFFDLVKTLPFTDALYDFVRTKLADTEWEIQPGAVGFLAEHAHLVRDEIVQGVAAICFMRPGTRTALVMRAAIDLARAASKPPPERFSSVWDFDREKCVHRAPDFGGVLLQIALRSWNANDPEKFGDGAEKARLVIVRQLLMELFTIAVPRWEEWPDPETRELARIYWPLAELALPQARGRNSDGAAGEDPDEDAEAGRARPQFPQLPEDRRNFTETPAFPVGGDDARFEALQGLGLAQT
jgi:hypothetical protein